MHHARRTGGEAVTRRWAGLAGVVAGLAGLGLAGLVAWLAAPAGSPVTAVGELIIELLPAPLVNFGKETLGFADKPILLAMIVLGVLLLCGLAGRLEYRRRFAGAAVFAVVAVLGLIGVSAQPGPHADRVRAHRRRTAARLRDPAHLDHQAASLAPAPGGADAEAESADRRRFLGWTLVRRRRRRGRRRRRAAAGPAPPSAVQTAPGAARAADRRPSPPRPCPPGPTSACPT